MTLHFPDLYGLLLKTQKFTVLKYGKVCFILPSIVFLSFRGVSSLANVAKHTPSQRCSLSGFTFLMNPKGRTMKELESPVGHGWLGNQGGFSCHCSSQKFYCRDVILRILASHFISVRYILRLKDAISSLILTCRA